MGSPEKRTAEQTNARIFINTLLKNKKSPTPHPEGHAKLRASLTRDKFYAAFLWLLCHFAHRAF